MNYRKLGNTGLSVSEVGFGGEHINNTPYENVENVINIALDHGVNIIDVFMPEPQIRSDMGKAIGERRKDVFLQGHIGAICQNGQYARSRDVAECDVAVRDFLTRFNTDYIDLGMIHFIDTEEDFQAAFESDYIEYVQKLKKDGVIRCIGVSSHNAETAIKIIKTGIPEMLMFSINPAFDMLPAETVIDDLFNDNTYKESRFEIDPRRAELYRLCEEKGVGITVMKALGAGRLLEEATSPFGVGLTATQCIHYALERPAVASVLMGAKYPDQMLESLKYVNATTSERDYTAIANGKRSAMQGKCVYCNHCLPCPSNIDIAAVTKYLDMARERGASGTIQAHYEALNAHAEDCIACGSCETNCPFNVKVIENMHEAVQVFGK